MKKVVVIILALIMVLSTFCGCKKGNEEMKIDYESYNVTDRIFMFKVWNFQVLTLSNFKKIVDAVKEDGFNMIVVHLVWAKAEPKEGKYDLERYAKMAQYVIDQGLKVGFDVDLLRAENDGYLKKEDIMFSRSGKMSSGGTTFSKSQFSLCSENAVEKAVGFYRYVVEFMQNALGDEVYCYIPTMTQYAETEYWCADEYDYGETAIKAFKAWLEEKYKDADKMNDKLGCGYASFDDVIAPATTDVSDPLCLDWYTFRHEKLKNVIDKLSFAQHEVAPDSKMAVQFGSVFDSACKTRCTYNYPDLCENVQIVWIDDAPTYDHNFSVNYLRSNVPADMICANEIDAPDQNGASPEVYFNQADESFKFGCNIVNVANWKINTSYKNYQPTWHSITEKWLNNEAKNVIPNEETETITVKLTDAIRFGLNDFRAKYNELSNNGEKFVWLKLEDDLIKK